MVLVVGVLIGQRFIILILDTSHIELGNIDVCNGVDVFFALSAMQLAVCRFNNH